MAPPHVPPSRVLIIGGGAGGLELAISLARSGAYPSVTLVDRASYHIWKPRLHELAVGLLVAADERADYATQARQHGFHFLLGEAGALDLAQNEVVVGPVHYPEDDVVATARIEPMLPRRTVPFDIAVLAVGSTVNDFGTPGVSAYAYALDTVGGAERLHTAILQQAARVSAGLQKAVRVAIVGAGTTGVELAAELRTAAIRLPQYRCLINPTALEVTLIEGADRPLPSSSMQLSDSARAMLAALHVDLKVGSKVRAVEAGRVLLDDGSEVGSDLTVWASGIKAAQLAAELEGVGRGRSGRVTVDPQLRVLAPDGTPIERLFAIGDCASLSAGSDGTPLPATAQVAHQQAKYLARSMRRRLRGEDSPPFQFRYQGTLVSLGKAGAVGTVPFRPRGEINLKGIGARMAYAALYQAHLTSIFGIGRAVALAIIAVLRRSTHPAIKLPW